MDILTFINSLPPSFSGFLAFLGTSVFAAFIVSEFLDHVPQFVALNTTAKSAIVLALYVGLGLLSFGLVHWVPPTVSEQLQPIYSVIIGTITAFLGGQWWHDNHPATPADKPAPPVVTAAG